MSMHNNGAHLAPRYDHTDFEARIYELWRAGGYFSVDGAARAQQRQWTATALRQAPSDPFVIAIPPPNVTGILHMGHGLNISLQDICIRYKRMRGHETLWIPGCDHAGIATQHVVERILRQRGIERKELGRAAFLKEARVISEEHHRIISEQIRKMGASCDWSREAFTLDERRSRSVREAFVRLYEKNYLYRGEYLVNWCTHCGTALSDDEVMHYPITGGLYRIRYPLVGSDQAMEIVTTRPETMLGDEAIAIHPEDERWTRYLNKKVLLPLSLKEIPIIADSYIDREFGSGVLKVTPAHDMNDFEIAKRHNLPIVSIFNTDGTLNERVPAQFRGLSIEEARRAVIKELARLGYLVERQEYTHQVGRCYRCNTIIEPLLSTQWFVRMRPLAEKALESWRKGEIKIMPARWEATYQHWLENIRDWCISRQLWWGHRIPVWYDQENGDIIVAREDPTNDPRYRGRALAQDEDVLDTWFSSWLWPFATLGWPEESDDFARYYPNSALITGYDIIFFWVTRMIMAGKEFTDKTPFRDIILTGLIRDKKGNKMSKSAGNGIDPLDVIRSHGADALKFSLVYIMAHGQDIRLATQDFAIGSRFANKIWNAARFVLARNNGRALVAADNATYSEVDRWIYTRLYHAIEATRAQMDQYRFSDAAHIVYDFFWNDFCDWYVEAAKHDINVAQKNDTEERRARVRMVCSHLVTILEIQLRLMHPFMSFITEELYQHIRPLHAQSGAPYPEAIIIAPYPTIDSAHHFPKEADQFTHLQSAITAVRTIRSEFSIAPAQECEATIVVADASLYEYVARHTALLAHLSRTKIRVVSNRAEMKRRGIAMVLPMGEAVVHIIGQIDRAAHLQKLTQEHEKNTKKLAQLEARLAPDSPFSARAKAEVIAEERDRLQQLHTTCATLARFIRDLRTPQ